mgnify:FL=1
MEGCGWKGFGGDKKRGVCLPNGRARGGHGQAPRAVRACPFGRKFGPNLSRKWVESGQKTDDSPFAAAHWEA